MYTKISRTNLTRYTLLSRKEEPAGFSTKKKSIKTYSLGPGNYMCILTQYFFFPVEHDICKIIILITECTLKTGCCQWAVYRSLWPGPATEMRKAQFLVTHNALLYVKLVHVNQAQNIYSTACKGGKKRNYNTLSKIYYLFFFS